MGILYNIVFNQASNYKRRWTFIHSDLYLITERRVPNVDMEYIYIILAPAENKRIRIALLLIYNNPKTDANKFL
jgi:hypothetical protein